MRSRPTRAAAGAVLAVALVAIPLWFGRGGDGVGVTLPGSFDVVEGSRLIGVPIPPGIRYSVAGRDVIDEGFIAIIAVDGDPLEVMNEYLRQAREQGLTELSPPSSEAGPVPCGDGGDRTDDVFTCKMGARTADPQDPRSLSIHFARGGVAGSQAFSHLMMTYSTTELFWEGTGGSESRESVRLPDVAEPIDPPGDDTSFFDGWAQTEHVRVEEGSRLLAELPEFECTAWMPQALLEVTGDPADVLRRYVDQLQRISHPEPPEIRDPLEVEGGHLTVALVAELGGLSYALRLFESEEHGDWLRIESCYD